MPQTILLVDDEYSSLEVLALLLAQEGYEVVTASDGEEALARLRERRVDLVITDYWMPRLNGQELCERMQDAEDLRRIPVLMVTAAYDAEPPASPRLVGILPKPLRFEAVLEAVRRALS